MNKNTFFIILILLFINCKEKDSLNYAKISFNNVYDFGEAKVGDTINAVFKIKNLSNTNLKIKNIKSDCSCTTSKISDSIINKDAISKIEIYFIASIDDIGIVEKTVVIDSNTKPNFNVLNIKGKIIE